VEPPEDREDTGLLEAPPTLTCVDCGGTCHLLSTPYQDGEQVGFRPGDVVAYRCAECLDRWDVVVE
jgi:hypothetical protein